MLNYISITYFNVHIFKIPITAIQKLPTHSGDTLDDYDKEKFKEKKDKNKKGINYDSSSSEDDEMAVRSTFSMVNKNTVLRNQTIRKEQG